MGEIDLPDDASTDFDEQDVVNLLRMYNDDYNREFKFVVDGYTDIHNTKDNLEEDPIYNYFLVTETINSGKCKVFVICADGTDADILAEEIEMYINNNTKNINARASNDSLTVSASGGGGLRLSLG